MIRRESIAQQKWIAALTLLVFAFSPSSATPLYAANALPKVHASPAPFKLEIAPELGVVQEIHPGHSEQIVIHIQDAHANYSAQKNIAAMIAHLKANYGFDTVAAEGAPRGAVDTSPISWIPVKNRLPIVLDSLLQKAFITGPEYQHALSEKDFHYLGIEDPALHRQNLSEYLEGIARKDSVAPAIAALRRELSDIKRRVYNKKLYELDLLIQQYRLSQEKYHERIFDDLKKVAEFAAEQNIARDSFPQIDLLLKAEKTEGSAKPEWSRLEVERNELEKALKERLLRTKEERKISETDEYLARLEGLIGLELTREQYKAYLREKSRFRLAAIGKWLQTFHASFQLENDLERRLQPFEYFYETAVKRDNVLIKNLMNQFPKSGKVILVAGGFHTEGLEAELRKKGVTYVSVSPQINSFPADAQETYFASLRREKSKLAQTLIRLSAQTINQAPGSLDPYADVVTFAEFLQWELAESRFASQQKDLTRVAAIRREIQDTGRVLTKRNPRYARLFRHPRISPGKIEFSSGTLASSNAVEVIVRPDLDTFKNFSLAIDGEDNRRALLTQVKVQPRSELRASQIRPEDYEDQPGDTPDQLEINRMMRLLSQEVTVAGSKDAGLPNDPYVRIEEAFNVYKILYTRDFSGGPMQAIPNIGAPMKKAGMPWIDRQLLQMMSFNALETKDLDEKKIWASMFLHIVPVRNSVIETKFPGVLYFLSSLDRELKGQIKAALALHSKEKGLRLDKPGGTFLEGTDFSNDIVLDSNNLAGQVAEFVKDPNQTMLDIRKLPYSEKNVNEFFTMLKPPGMTDNPETVRKYFQRIYAFGYEPAGIRVIRGSSLPDSFLRRHYPEIGEWALYGQTNLLSSIGENNFRLRYKPFYGKELLDPPNKLAPPPDKKYIFEVDPQTDLPKWPIRGFEDIFTDNYSHLPENERREKRLQLHEKFADYYARIEKGKFVSNEEGGNTAQRSPADRLWSRQQGIEAPPNTRDVTLFYDRELYDGKPFFVPNMFFSGFASKYKQPNSVILAVVMREKTAHAVEWENLRNSFVGEKSQPNLSLPGSLRWDAQNGKLGNDPALINYLTNGVHGSTSAIEAVMEMRLWLSDLNVQTLQDENLFPVVQTTFGQALIRAGFSTEQIDDLISSTELKKILKIKNADEALELILKWQIPLLNLQADKTAPIDYPSYMQLVNQYNSRGIGIEKNAIDASINAPAPGTSVRSELRTAQKGRILVMIGPSGAGKTKLMQMLIQKYLGQFYAVTQFTTRATRPKEADGVDYHFISRDRFQTLEKENRLTLIRGRIGRYGILKEEIEQSIREGKTPVLNFQEPEEIEQLKNTYPDILLDIFAILPMEVKDWNDEISDKMADLVRERLVRRDPSISQIEIDDRINSMKTSVPKLLQLPDVSVIVNEKGKTEAAFEKLEADLKRSGFQALRGRALAVIGPSVSGKNELISRLIKEPDGHRFQEMIQFTTRMPRPQELDGIDYRFIRPEEFQSLKEQNKLSFIRGRTAYYGVSRGAAEELVSQGKIPIFNLQDAEEIDQLKKTYANLDIDVFVILPVKVDEWDQGARDRLADLMRRRLIQRDPQISEAHIQDRLESAMAAIPKLLELQDAAFIVNEEGQFDAAFESFAASIRRSEVRAQIFTLDTEPAKFQEAKAAGSAVLKAGRVGVVINTADTGEHPYFSGGAAATSMRMLRSIGVQGNRDITSAEIKLRHIHVTAQEEKGNISVDIGLDKGELGKFQQELAEHKNYDLTDETTPLGLFNLGHVPYRMPREEELKYAYQQLREPVSPDVESYVKENAGSPVRNADGEIQGTNMGNLDILIQFVLSGRMKQRLKEGKDIFYFSNGEDLGGLIDKAKIGLFANSPEKVWFVAVEADQVFHISEIDSRRGKWTVVMRKGKPVISNLPNNHSVTIENGRLVVRKKEGESEPGVKIVVEPGEPEYGAYLVNVNDQPRFVERTAFPLGYDFGQLKPVLINTNQMLIKADAILDFFNLTREEYMRIGQKELLGKVVKAAEKMKTYTQIDWITLLINEKDNKKTKIEVPIPGVKWVRLLADLSAHMDAGYLLVDRESHYGWYPIVSELDTYLLGTQTQIDDLLKEVTLSGHPAEDLLGNERDLEFRDDLKDGKRILIHTGAKPIIGVAGLSERYFGSLIDVMIRLKLQHSRFPGLNSDFFLGSAVEEDFLGKGLLTELTQAELRERNRRQEFLLDRIYHSRYRWEFLKFLWEHKHSLVTFRNVNSPIYVALVNYLLGRPLQDRRFAEAHRRDLFANNVTLNEHPVFGTTPAAKVPLDPKDQILLPEPPKDLPLRVLFFGAGEKYGPNSKLDYLREILRALPDQRADRVEVHAWDINFQKTIYVLDETAESITPKQVFPFDRDGKFYDSGRQIHFRKLKTDNPQQMATTDAYNLADSEKFDVVIMSRVEIWYKREPQMRYALFRNMVKHLAPGGVLFYDNHATDRLKVIRRDELDQITTLGYIPYQDVASGEKDLARVLRKFRRDSEKFIKNNTLQLKYEQVDEMMKNVYQLASKYVKEGHYIFDEKIFANFIAQFSQNPISTAAIFIHHVPDAAIREVFSSSPAVADALIREKNSFGDAVRIEEDQFGRIFYRWLEEDFYRPQALEPHAADTFLSDATHIIGNAKFSIEHGLAVEHDEENGAHFIPALRMTNHETKQTIIYYPPKERRRSERRSEIRRDYRQNAVPFSERSYIRKGLKPGEIRDADQFLRAIQNIPKRALDVFSLEPFSLPERLKRSEVVTVRENNESRASVIQSWKEGKSFGPENLGVLKTPDHKMVIEETLANDFIDHGLPQELAAVVEEKELQDALEAAGVPQPRTEAKKVLAASYGRSVIDSDELRARPDDFLYYFTARKYGLEKQDLVAQKIATAYAARDYRRSELRLLGPGKKDWKKAQTQVLPRSVIQGAIVVTEAQIENGTVTKAELTARMQDDSNGQIQLHFITKPGRDLASGRTVFKKILGKWADGLLFDALKNPQGRIHIHTVPNFQSTQAAIHRVSAGLKQTLLPAPGEAQVQDYQIILIADEKTAQNVHHGVVKFVARGQNVGLLSAAYLFIPYRGNIPDSIFGSNFHKGDLFNTYYLTPLENLGFFLRETAEIQRHILTQA